MAETRPQELKKFILKLGENGHKEHNFLGVYQRERTMHDADGKIVKDPSRAPEEGWSIRDKRKILFGLSSKEENYPLQGPDETGEATVFARLGVTSSNLFRTRSTGFHENGHIKYESRKDRLGNFRDRTHDRDGDLQTQTVGNILMSRSSGDSEDRRTTYTERKTLLTETRREGVILSNGDKAGWRTTKRVLGPFRRNIDVTSKDSETRSWSLGKRFGRKSEYDFVAGTRKVTYEYWPFAKKTEANSKPMSDRQLQKHEERTKKLDFAEYKSDMSGRNSRDKTDRSRPTSMSRGTRDELLAEKRSNQSASYGEQWEKARSYRANNHPVERSMKSETGRGPEQAPQEPLRSSGQKSVSPRRSVQDLPEYANSSVSGGYAASSVEEKHSRTMARAPSVISNSSLGEKPASQKSAPARASQEFTVTAGVIEMSKPPFRGEIDKAPSVRAPSIANSSVAGDLYEQRVRGGNVASRD